MTEKLKNNSTIIWIDMAKKMRKMKKIEYIVQGDGRISSNVFTEEQRRKYTLLEKTEHGNIYISDMGDVVITRYHEQRGVEKHSYLSIVLVICLCIVISIFGIKMIIQRNTTDTEEKNEDTTVNISDATGGSDYVPGKVVGHPQVDEADMLKIVWHVFPQNNTEQVYCADFDRDGWMEAFVERKDESDEDYKEIWFMNHSEETVLITEGGYLYLSGTVESNGATLMVVNGRHGMDSVYYVDQGIVGDVLMPDGEWWYSLYEENGVLWGKRVEYSDGKEYVDHQLRYDTYSHKLEMI